MRLPRPTPDSPGPGQESCWDYPRPPRLEQTSSHVEVMLDGEVVAATDAPLRVLETSHPPTYYLPRSCFADGVLRPASGRSFCEWKGVAAYFDVVGPRSTAQRSAWLYPSPTAPFAQILDHVAVYPGAVDRCTVDGETVRPQPGGFYGGWVVSTVSGPFKGVPGSDFW